MDDITTFADMARELGLPKKLLYSVKEVSRVLGVPCSTLYAEHKAGRLKFKTYGKRNALISVEELDRWMNEN